MNAHPRQTAARWAIASAIGLALEQLLLLLAKRFDYAS